MRNLTQIRVIGICFIFVFLVLTCLHAQQEQLTITTYYPSPHGSYREIRAQRMAIGDTYFGSGYCWPPDSCANNVDTNADLVVEGNVGIGTPNPQAILDLDVRTRIVAGQTGSGFLPPRMTSAELGNIQNPPEASIAYDTTRHDLMYRDQVGAWYPVARNMVMREPSGGWAHQVNFYYGAYGTNANASDVTNQASADGCIPISVTQIKNIYHERRTIRALFLSLSISSLSAPIGVNLSNGGYWLVMNSIPQSCSNRGAESISGWTAFTYKVTNHPIPLISHLFIIYLSDATPDPFYIMMRLESQNPNQKGINVFGTISLQGYVVE
jgi:hypothetical protein